MYFSSEIACWLRKQHDLFKKTSHCGDHWKGQNHNKCIKGVDGSGSYTASRLCCFAWSGRGVSQRHKYKKEHEEGKWEKVGNGNETIIIGNNHSCLPVIRRQLSHLGRMRHRCCELQMTANHSWNCCRQRRDSAWHVSACHIYAAPG